MTAKHYFGVIGIILQYKVLLACYVLACAALQNHVYSNCKLLFYFRNSLKEIIEPKCSFQCI